MSPNRASSAFSSLLRRRAKLEPMLSRPVHSARHIPKPKPKGPEPSEDPATIRSSPLFLKRRNYVLAGAVAIITIAGTLIGASLKSTHQTATKQSSEKQVEIDYTKQIQLLEATRGQLMQTKVGIERKLEELKGRQQKQRELEAERQRVREMGGTSARVESNSWENDGLRAVQSRR